MSRANMRVEFDDGTTFFGLYNGTCDLPLGRLFHEQNEAWKIYDTGIHHLDGPDWPTDDAEPVRVWTDYGNSFYLPPCVASKSAMCVWLLEEPNE